MCCSDSAPPRTPPPRQGEEGVLCVQAIQLFREHPRRRGMQPLPHCVVDSEGVCEAWDRGARMTSGEVESK